MCQNFGTKIAILLGLTIWVQRSILQILSGKEAYQTAVLYEERRITVLFTRVPADINRNIMLKKGKKSMKRQKLVLSLFSTVLLMVNGIGLSYAGELKINGFADTIWTLSDEAKDNAGTKDSDGNAANSTERKVDVTGEVDIEYNEGPVTFRMDLDIPSSGNEANGLVPGVPPRVPKGDIGIEQAKFVWAIPKGEPYGLSLTGGAFNAPIGFELQDAPDLYQTSNGQLFGLVPANLAGVMVSGGTDMVALDVYFVNEWKGTLGTTGEENSVGGLLTIAPIEQASLAVGYLTSNVDKASTATGLAPGEGDGDILDIVASGTISPMPMLDVLLAFEYLTDEFNDGWAIVTNVMHNTAHPHGLTIRYDSVDCDAGSNYCRIATGGTSRTPTSLTVAAILEVAENLSTLIEWRTNDADVSTASSTDLLTWEFIATF